MLRPVKENIQMAQSYVAHPVDEIHQKLPLNVTKNLLKLNSSWTFIIIL